MFRSASQQINMTGVQNIKAAVGENDSGSRRKRSAQQSEF
jgi:hypothetical protein